MTSTPPATRRADTSLTGLGKEKRLMRVLFEVDHTT